MEWPLPTTLRRHSSRGPCTVQDRRAAHRRCVRPLFAAHPPVAVPDFATRWRLIKTRFTKRCDPALRGTPNQSRIKRNEQAIWQHRYWEHKLKDEIDFKRHVDYIHYNPVKHALVASPHEWPYSSFNRYVEAEIYPSNWGSEELDLDDIGHE